MKAVQTILLLAALLAFGFSQWTAFCPQVAWLNAEWLRTCQTKAP